MIWPELVEAVSHCHETCMQPGKEFHQYLDLHLFALCLARCDPSSRMYKSLQSEIKDFEESKSRVERLGTSRGTLSRPSSEVLCCCLCVTQVASTVSTSKDFPSVELLYSPV